MGYCVIDETVIGEKELATQAIVFMVKGVNDPLLIPVAYYFINSLTGVQRANLLSGVITAVTDSGARVRSVTFDGLPANIAMCEYLGANMNSRSLNFNPLIDHPTADGLKIPIVLDPCHLEKNARNTLAGKGLFMDDQDRKIE